MPVMHSTKKATTITQSAICLQPTAHRMSLRAFWGKQKGVTCVAKERVLSWPQRDSDGENVLIGIVAKGVLRIELEQIRFCIVQALKCASVCMQSRRAPCKITWGVLQCRL